MQYRLRTQFYFKDGSMKELAVAIPAEVADKINVHGLIATRIFVDGKISNITSPLKKPEFMDFKG